MKKIFTFLAAILIVASVWAQSPQKMSYQAVIRNSLGQLVVNHAVGMRISILQGTAPVYVETQTPLTNANGLVSIEIGGGTGFDMIDWSNGTYFIMTETDPTGGTDYTITGTSQLLSVPFALYSAKAGAANYTETDPIFANSAAKDVTANGTSNWNTAYSWGNHAGLYRPISYVPLWGEIIGRPTTIAGYGITDAMSTAHAANAIAANNITNWNAAFGWGNHAGLYRPINYVPAWADITSKPTTLAGFGITNGMSTAHPANAITATNITNWNTAFGWGNHAGLYRPISYVPTWTEVTGKPTFATVATTGSYNDLLNKPAPYTAGAGILFTGSTISANLGLQVSETGDILTLTPGNSIYVPGISNANSSIPIVTTKPVTNITSTKAYGNGNLVYYGTTQITETGICWSLNQPPTVADNHIASGVTNGDFICIMTGLTANTVYFARAYAKTGTTTYYYGQTVMFTTTDILPVATLTTTEVNSITETAALSGGNISADGGSAVTARGVCWSTSTGPTIALGTKTTNGTGTGIYTSSLTGLTLNTQYFVRAYSTNANGTSYGPELFFKTAGTLPSLSTNDASVITPTSALVGGNVSAIGSTGVTERGICYGLSPNPTTSDSKIAVGNGVGSFSTVLNNLVPNTIYYFRAYATSTVGTNYGLNKSFTTSSSYYAGCENGILPTGWTGMWFVSPDSPFEGFFCLKSVNPKDSIQFTRTITNPIGGQFSFYHKSSGNCGGSVTTNFFIDNVLQYSLTDEAWTIHTYTVTPGTHTFKWINKGGGCSNTTYIDYIICPD